MLRSRQEAALRDWLDVIPDGLVRVRPVLNVGFVGALVAGGEFEGVEARLREAEQWLDTTAGSRQRADGRPAEVVVVDDEGFRRLPGQIALYRAALALVRGDVPATVRHARQVLDRSPDDDHLTRAGAAAILGLAHWTNGDLEAAHRAYAESTAGLQRVGHISDVLGCTIALADIRIAQGRLGEALHTYERALQRVSEQDAPGARGTADMYVGMSEIHRERGELQVATEDLLKSQELGEHAGLPQNRYRWRVAMARIRHAEGDLGVAVELLDEAERLYVSDFFPNVRPIPAVRARVQVAQGDLGDALGWVREEGLSPDDDLSYLHEFDHITLARVLLAQDAEEHAAGALHAAVRLLDRLMAAAEEGGRTGSVVEILVLQALAGQADGDIPGALACLQRAVALAEPEGYVRVFLDEGPPMGVLLREAASQGIASNRVRRLVTAFGTAQDPRSAGQGMIEPLSDRELEVLRLLDTAMSVPEIARELFVSPNTLRTHTRHIFTKLEVNNRRAAVDRAAELGLL
jgi:LuxR family maltose regulon positive regulatory protein